MVAAYALPGTSMPNYSMTGRQTTSLQTALSSPGAARQAFIMREIFDRPLCLRHAPNGGHEDWN
jgi:hypothetical protein